MAVRLTFQADLCVQSLVEPTCGPSREQRKTLDARCRLSLDLSELLTCPLAPGLLGLILPDCVPAYKYRSPGIPRRHIALDRTRRGTRE